MRLVWAIIGRGGVKAFPVSPGLARCAAAAAAVWAPLLLHQSQSRSLMRSAGAEDAVGILKAESHLAYYAGCLAKIRSD